MSRLRILSMCSGCQGAASSLATTPAGSLPLGPRPQTTKPPTAGLRDESFFALPWVMTLVALSSPPPVVPTSELEAAVTGRRPFQDRLRAAQLDLARCAGTLAWMAEHPGPETLEQGRTISRHMRAIRKYVELELRERKTLGRPDVELRSEGVEEVVGLLLDTFERVSRQVLSEDEADVVMQKTREGIRGWQDQV